MRAYGANLPDAMSLGLAIMLLRSSLVMVAPARMKPNSRLRFRVRLAEIRGVGYR